MLPRYLLCFLWTALLVMTTSLWAATQARALDISASGDAVDLTPHLTHAPGQGLDLAVMLARFRAGGFSAGLELDSLSTNYAPEAWSGVELTNTSLDDGRPPDPFAITLHLPLVSEVDIYLIRDSGLTETLLTYSIFAPFDPAQHAATRLRTVEFQVAPGEQVTLLAHVKYGPFQTLRMALQSPLGVAEQTVRDTAGLTAFYAASLAALAFFLAFYVALRDWISLLYAALFLAGLAFIAFMDGLLFRLLYPDRPELQSAVGFFLLYALSGAGFLLAGHGLASAGRSRLARLCRGLAGVSAVGFLLALASPGPYAALLAEGLLAISLVAIPFGTGAWRQKQGRTHATALWLSLATVGALLLVVVLVASGWARETVPLMGAIRIVYLTMLVATITNFAAHVILIRRAHARAVAAQMQALETEAQTAQELLETERAYTRARDLARHRQRQLATASHDLKQPLASLRMTFDSLGERLEPDLRARLGEAFDYIEGLSGEYLRDAAPQDDGDIALPPPEAEEQTEPYALGLILQTVQQMFQQDAISKGLRLDLMNSSAQVQVPPLVLMRIASNLVSNAVNHTDRGRVLIGARRRGSRVELWVCDTGPGMSADQIASFRQEGQKGAGSQGHGLGLAVCFAQAEAQGLNLTPVSRPGHGTVFRLSIPVVPAPAHAAIGGSAP